MLKVSDAMGRADGVRTRTTDILPVLLQGVPRFLSDNLSEAKEARSTLSVAVGIAWADRQKDEGGPGETLITVGAEDHSDTIGVKRSQVLPLVQYLRRIGRGLEPQWIDSLLPHKGLVEALADRVEMAGIQVCADGISELVDVPMPTADYLDSSMVESGPGIKSSARPVAVPLAGASSAAIEEVKASGLYDVYTGPKLGNVPCILSRRGIFSAALAVQAFRAFGKAERAGGEIECILGAHMVGDDPYLIVHWSYPSMDGSEGPSGFMLTPAAAARFVMGVRDAEEESAIPNSDGGSPWVRDRFEEIAQGIVRLLREGVSGGGNGCDDMDDSELIEAVMDSEDHTVSCAECEAEKDALSFDPDAPPPKAGHHAAMRGPDVDLSRATHRGSNAVN